MTGKPEVDFDRLRASMEDAGPDDALEVVRAVRDALVEAEELVRQLYSLRASAFVRLREREVHYRKIAEAAGTTTGAVIQQVQKAKLQAAREGEAADGGAG